MGTHHEVQCYTVICRESMHDFSHAWECELARECELVVIFCFPVFASASRTYPVRTTRAIESVSMRYSIGERAGKV